MDAGERAIRPPRLNSHQLNYLIWRYLQESGYGEAAVKLQRDWNIGDPQSLTFAKHIQFSALPQLVTHGLSYYHIKQTIDENGEATKELQPSMFYFGPESSRPEVIFRHLDPDLESTAVSAQASAQAVAMNGRKHPRDSIPSSLIDQDSHTAKRSRKVAVNHADKQGDAHRNEPREAEDVQSSNNIHDIDIDKKPDGMVNGDHNDRPAGHLIAQQASTSEVDGEKDTLAEVGPKEDLDMEEDAAAGDGADVGPFSAQDQDQQDQLERLTVNDDDPPPPIITTGPSVGVQMSPARIKDLEPQAKILAVAGDSNITRLLWRPSGSTVLADAGEQFCGLWKVSDDDRAITASYHPITESLDHLIVSAVAWDPTGQLLAVATYNDADLAGKLRVYEVTDADDLTLIANPPTAQKMILSLKWHALGSRILGSATDTNESFLVMWDVSDVDAALTWVKTPEALQDIDWASHGDLNTICAAGEGVVYACKAAADIVVEQKWQSDVSLDAMWNFVRCSWLSEESVIAIAASADSARIWIPSKDVYQHQAHHAPITGLELRPTRIDHPRQSLPHEFATSSMDNTIKIWRFADRESTLSCVYKVSMGQSSPAMALAFSPDGTRFAGASYDRVHIWDAAKGSQPLATWLNSATWQGERLKQDDLATDDGMRSDDGEKRITVNHILSWDSDNERLTFGLGRQIAVISTR